MKNLQPAALSQPVSRLQSRRNGLSGAVPFGVEVERHDRRVAGGVVDANRCRIGRSAAPVDTAFPATAVVASVAGDTHAATRGQSGREERPELVGLQVGRRRWRHTGRRVAGC